MYKAYNSYRLRTNIINNINVDDYHKISNLDRRTCVRNWKMEYHTVTGRRAKGSSAADIFSADWKVQVV